MNNVYEKVFESNNIVFVKINEKLINEYLDLVNTPSIQDLVNSKRKVISLEKELEWIKSKIENNDYVFSMLEKDTNMFIGNVELMQNLLYQLQRVCKINIMVKKQLLQ